ncbi:hypothetical protein TRFO_34968 [Tritrichomonas foetus]|uniref:C2 domain-containing protein n=1 Tax=Tritrichomonas foetus TaxID=1144522 RepID=A0A1J4JJ66_9EUKA|nr:hypothetical protein TRFO_34968 [Tritrichomonas foetus]|eukprot:OHS98633.1 hypothetical protein TRFO_34968 [Tritrichomonas foetus]
MIDLSSGNYSSSRKSTNSPILKKPSPRKPVDGILKESSSNQNEPNTKQISVNFDSSSLKYHKSSHNSKDKKSPYNNTAQLSNIDFDTILAAPNTSSGIHNDIDFKTVDLDFEETENAQENGKKNANDKKTKKNKDPKTADLGFETVDLEFERIESYSSQSGSEVEEEHEHKSKSTNKLTQQNPPISNKIENDEKSYTYEYETIGVEDDYSNDSTHTYTYVSEYIEYSSAPTSETEYEYVEEEEEEEEIPEKVDTRNLKLKSSNIKQQNTTITKVSSPSKQQQILQQYQIQKQQVQNPTRQFTFVSSANDANISIAPFYQNNNTVKYADKETLKKKSPHRTVSREPRQIQNSHQNLSGSFSSFDVGPSRALQEMQREMAKYVNLPRSVAHPSYNLPTERAAVIDDSGKMTEITKMLAQPPPEKFIKRWMDQDDADFTLESESIFTESIRSEVEEEEENAESVNNESKVQSSASYTYVIEEEEDEENEPENEEEEEKKENSTPSTTMKSFTELFDDMSTSSSQKPVQKVQKQYSSATIFSSEVSRNVEIENEVSENSSTLAENQNEEKEEELVTQDIECSQSDQIIEIIEEEEVHESFHSDVQHETQEEQQSKPESSQNSSILEKTSDISSLAESKPEKHESETQHQESDVDNESNKNSTIESSGKASNQNENEQENLNESATTDKDYSSTLHEESNDYDEEEEEEEDFLEKNRTSGIRSTLFPPLKLNFKKQHSSSDNSEEGSSFDSLDDSTSTKTNPISSLRVCIVELQFPTAISCRVSLSLRGDTDTVETNDCDPSIQPRFNEKYNVPIEDANHDELSIRVISNNKSIAQAFIPTNIFPLETFVDKWFDLTPVGRIRLTVRSSADESDNEGYSDDPSTASLNFSHNESDLFSEEGNLASLAAKYNSPRGMIYNLNTNENNSNIEANEVQKNENNSIFNSSSSSSSSSSLAGKESDKNEQEPNVAQNNQVVPEIDSDDDSADSYEEKSFDTDPIVLSQQIEIEEEEEIAEIMNLPSPSLKTQNKSDIQVANLKDALQSSSLNLSDYQNDSDSSSFQFDEHNLENYMKKNG